MTSKEEIIKSYFQQGYSYEEIRDVLIAKGFPIPLRHLQRNIKAIGLKRKQIEEDLSEILSAVLKELEGSGSCIGYKTLWLRLKLKYGLNVYRETVLELLHLLDPEGIELRSKYRLKRREYKVLGPNFLWHIDGHDKLKPFGFAIHVCIDGFSRKIIWLKVGSTNNNPEVIAYYYLKAIKKLKIVPSVIRSDHGTENNLVEPLQAAFRLYHGDVFAADKSFIRGKSTANQRIESTWGRLKRHGLNFWIVFFKDLVNKGHFDKTNSIQLECLRFCFGPLIQYDLDLMRQEWNRHSIRKQKFDSIIPGKPNFLYYMPQNHGTKDYGHQVESIHIDNAMENLAQKSEYCSKVFLQLVTELLPNDHQNDHQNALKLYHKILDELAKY